jgi:hypothetical protein
VIASHQPHIYFSKLARAASLFQWIGASTNANGMRKQREASAGSSIITVRKATPTIVFSHNESTCLQLQALKKVIFYCGEWKNVSHCTRRYNLISFKSKKQYFNL